MSDILSGIQNFIIVVFTVVTTTLTAIFPFYKPLPSPTPTPVAEVKQDITPTSSTGVLGVKDVQKDEKYIPAPSKKTALPSPTPLQDTNFSPPSANNSPLYSNSYQAPNYNYPSIKTDYSSYKTALQATLASLRTRLSSVQSQADRVPQEVDSQINSINSRLQSDLLNLETSYNQNTTNLSREFGQRGIPLSSGLFQDELRSLTDSYNNSRSSLISQADQEKGHVFANAENKIYQADAQDKDSSNKIAIVEGLINKISSGSFTDSDIPLAIQAMYY